MPLMRARLTVLTVTRGVGFEKVEFNAQYTGHPEDNTYAAHAPMATASFQVTNPALFGKMQPGSSYYVDFTAVAVATASAGVAAATGGD